MIVERVSLHEAARFPSSTQVSSNPCTILASDRSAGEIWMLIGTIWKAERLDLV